MNCEQKLIKENNNMNYEFYAYLFIVQENNGQYI